MDTNNLYKSRILALKVIAEYYLLQKGNKKTEEIFGDRRITDETELVAGDLEVLHAWLREEYEKLGLDLEAIIEEHEGEATEENANEVSEYEMQLFTAKADELTSLFGILGKYIDAKEQREGTGNKFVPEIGSSLADKWAKISADLADFGKEVAEKLDK